MEQTINQRAFARIRRSRKAIVALVVYTVPMVVLSVYSILRGEGEVLEFLAYAVLLPWGVYYAYIVSAVRKEFWQAFAKEYGLEYAERGDFTHEKAFMFTRLDKSRPRITHVLSGTVDGRLARLMSYEFVTGSGKRKTSHYFTVFEFKLNGSTPHIFLDRKSTKWSGPSDHSTIPLHGEFGDEFNLIVPIKYEMEVLALFSEDVMELLAKDDHPHDVEIVDGELLIFRDGLINSRAELEKEFDIAKRLLGLIGSKLDKASYTKIGDLKDVM